MHDARAEALSPFSERGFRHLAQAELSLTAPVADPGAPDTPSDFDLSPDLIPEAERAPLTAAAVLIPIVARAELTVLLTQRTEGLPHHAGQIAFPGGRMEATDRDPIATALREAREEIGLDPRFVEPLGYLDAYRTGTGFRIFPVVSLVREGFTLKLDAREVADAFEVPLAIVMVSQNHKRETIDWSGFPLNSYVMQFGNRKIWGATAIILRNLYERIYRS